MWGAKCNKASELSLWDSMLHLRSIGITELP
jgi:hypothetical protein